MTFRRLLEHALLAIVLAGIFCPSSFSQALLAQGPLPDAPQPVVETAPVPIIASTPVSPLPIAERHRFWDFENRSLFAGVVAANAADFAVTYTNLQSGGRELNPVVRIFGRSAPGLALNFGGQTAGVMGFSYFLHKTGHHKLERFVSMTNIGAGIGAVTYGLTHR